MSEGGVAQEGFRPGRLLVLLVFLAAGFAAVVWLARSGPSAMPWTCMLNEWTGLHCPGCGMTRATSAAVHGDVKAAFGFNPVGIVLLPVTIIALLPEAIAWVNGRPPLWRVPIGKYGAWAIFWLIAGFTVLRNLPWEPFSWLAP